MSCRCSQEGEQEGGVIRLEIVRNQHDGAMSCVSDIRLLLMDEAAKEDAGAGAGAGGDAGVMCSQTPPLPPPSRRAGLESSSSRETEAGSERAWRQNQTLAITEDERKDSIGMWASVFILLSYAA